MISGRLRNLKAKHLLRYIKNRNSHQGTKIILGEKEYINFSSNDYLGLANHPSLIESACKAMKKFGFGSGASRLLGGGTVLHEGLEKRIASFKNTEAALVFNSGYAANTGIIPVIANKGDAIFSDELNHASIIDGCRLSKAKTHIYKHKDTAHLKRLLRKTKAKNKIVITDSVFSMGGDIAPLEEIYDICSALNNKVRGGNCLLYIDDAHATGVLGNGRGSLAHFGLKPMPWVIQMGTFSKALGSLGAFAAGSKVSIDWLINAARSFIFSTALPSCVIAASIAALEVIEKKPELIQKLWRNRDNTVRALEEIGHKITGSETPVIPLKTGTVENTLAVSEMLLKKGIFAPAIRPPTVSEPIIRITITAAHTDKDITTLAKALSNY